MTKKFDYAVFIGRFQPFHKGHLRVVEKALEEAKELIIVLGSSFAPRNTRNILTADERKEIIQAAVPLELLPRIKITAISDYRYNDDKWTTAIQQAVFSTIHRGSFNPNPYSIALAGMSKDESSYYLNIFPQWDSITVLPDENVISATDIRKAYAGWVYKGDDIAELMGEAAAEKYFDIMDPIWPSIKSDFEYEDIYEAKWGKGPHLTADSCIVQSGHLLLIQRGAEYGHGTWALPGGFINPKETSFEASLRELHEETKIKVPEKVLRGSLVKSELFDDPYRSNRSRIVTNAFYYRLGDMAELPKVKGSDDAQDAKWIPLSKVANMRNQMFEDHYDIISKLTGAF